MLSATMADERADPELTAPTNLVLLAVYPAMVLAAYFGLQFLYRRSVRKLIYDSSTKGPAIPHEAPDPGVSSDPGGAPALMRITGYPASDRVTEILRRSRRRVWRRNALVLASSALPDIASAALDPRAISRWLVGGLRRYFLSTTDELEERLRRLRSGRTNDGRFPPVEIPCLEAAWRGVIQSLARRVDVAIMHLRGFRADNVGCIFELSVLLPAVGPSRIILIADETSDLASLHRILRSVIPDESVELPPIFRLDGSRPAHVRALACRVLDATTAANSCELPA